MLINHLGFYYTELLSYKLNASTGPSSPLEALYRQQLFAMCQDCKCHIWISSFLNKALNFNTFKRIYLLLQILYFLFLFVYITKTLLYFLLQVLKLAINIWFIKPSGIYFVYDMYFCSMQKVLFPRGHLYHVSSFRAGGPESALCPVALPLSVSVPRSQASVLILYFNTEPRFLTGPAPLFLTSALAILALCLSTQIWGSLCQVSLQAKLNQIKYPTRI